MTALGAAAGLLPLTTMMAILTRRYVRGSKLNPVLVLLACLTLGLLVGALTSLLCGDGPANPIRFSSFLARHL